MAKSINKVILVGHLGNDPEIRVTKDNKKVAGFNMATSEVWYDKESGEKHEKVDWHKVVIYSGPLVEVAEKYLTRGAKVYVEGGLHNRQWVDNEGKNHTVTEVVLKNFRSNLSSFSLKHREFDQSGEPEEITDYNLTIE